MWRLGRVRVVLSVRERLIGRGGRFMSEEKGLFGDEGRMGCGCGVGG